MPLTSPVCLCCRDCKECKILAAGNYDKNQNYGANAGKVMQNNSLMEKACKLHALFG